MISYLNYSMAVIKFPFKDIFLLYLEKILFIHLLATNVNMEKYIILLYTVFFFSVKAFQIFYFSLIFSNFNRNCDFSYFSLCFLWVLLVLFGNLRNFSLLFIQLSFLLFFLPRISFT